MVWKKKGNVYGIRPLGMRKHKGKTFIPKHRARTKTEIYRILSRTALAHTHYYRIYHHKGRGYTLYVGPEKPSHGGIRHRPSRKRREASMRRKAWKYRTRYPKQEKVQPQLPVFKVRKINKGRHRGSYLDPQGTIITPTQYHIFRARNQNKYDFEVEE